MGNRNTRIPVVIGATGKVHRFEDGPVVCSIGPRTGWLDWLQRPTIRSFAYQGIEASMTCRKDKANKQGVPTYWEGWKTWAGEWHKIYLGASHKLTKEYLEQKALELAQMELAETGGEQWKHKPAKRQPQPKKKHKPILPPPQPAMVQASFLDMS